MGLLPFNEIQVFGLDMRLLLKKVAHERLES